ncbi:MAG: peptidase M15 [Gammaproteobacteria bacterium]|nr:peptidase M15 [Gammaproteobacteria bacterium]
MIDRRTFIAAGAGLTATLFASGHARLRAPTPAPDSAELAVNSLPSSETRVPLSRTRFSPPITDFHPDSMVLDQVASEPVAQLMPLDVILSPTQRIAFDSALARLRRLQNYVGHGNFNIVGWDQSLKLARARDAIGTFTRSELDLIEELFFTDAKTLGFYGDKVVTTLSASIAKRDVVKIPRSGHFLFKGSSTETFDKIRHDLGDSVVLTSGVRSVVKQIYLFMNKAEQVDGNLSLASFSLAPPGHSYHAVGDFDVGKKGFGIKNFSEAFAQTDEFKRLIDLGYLDIRYPQENPFGVRYEPWHIKVI